MSGPSFPLQAVAGVDPTPTPPDPPDRVILGVCLSGGGSRALTGALGALSGLRVLPDPDDPARSVIDRVEHVSSVSGGSWAAVTYTFLPEEVDGQPIDDDTFLIAPVAPDRLVKAGERQQPDNVEYMDPRCLGTSPQRFAALPIARVLLKYWRWGFFGDKAKWNWFWVAAIGELLLEPFDLYDAKYRRRSTVTEPTKSFSASAEYVRDDITTRNPELTDDQFHLVRAGRPALVVNFNLLEDERAVDPIQIPVQATPTHVGALGHSPDGTIVGGGSVQSFGFATELLGRGPAGEDALVSMNRRYSLSDITACSSAFFAEQLLQFVNHRMDVVERAIIGELRRRHLPAFIGKLFTRWLQRRCEPLLGADLSDLIPRYPYWTLGELDAAHPTTGTSGFSDGGSFDDTGVLGMLARTDVNRIVAFVNGAGALRRDSRTDEIIVEADFARLLGYHFDSATGRYVSYGGLNPAVPLSYVQVFDDTGGAFDALRQGLWDASTGHGADPLGTHTVAFLQPLTTIHNPVANIAAGREVTVLWVDNNRVNVWQDQIGDAAIQADLAVGQAGQHTDGTPNDAGRGRGPLANFPLYTTGPQVYLDKEAVNMMAQLAAWNVGQLEAEITELLRWTG